MIDLIWSSRFQKPFINLSGVKLNFINNAHMFKKLGAGQAESSTGHLGLQVAEQPVVYFVLLNYVAEVLQHLSVESVLHLGCVDEDRVDCGAVLKLQQRDADLELVVLGV